MIFQIIDKIRNKKALKKLMKTSKTGKFNNKNWKLTYDVLGIINTKPIRCIFCGTEMVIRHSRLHTSPELNHQNPHIDLAFKCPNCDWFTVFGIPVPKDYWLHILQLRKKMGIGLIYAPVESWTKSDQEIIKERLQALGYW